MFRRSLPRAFYLALGLAAGALPALAQERQQRQERPPPPLMDPEQLARAEALAREAIARLIGALDLFVQSLPQYDPPEINENGDIIIRRRNPPGAPRPPEGNQRR